MTEWKMIDADGHIREIESDVFEYLPAYYQQRREAVLYFHCCRTMVGIVRRAEGAWALLSSSEP